MKKLNEKEKEDLQNKFIDYLDKKNLIIKRNIYSLSYSLHMVSNKNKEKQSPHYINDLIQEKNTIKNLSEENIFYNFLDELVKKSDTQNMALWFARKLEPAVNYDGFDSYSKNILKVLSFNKELYFQYVARPKFLNATMEKLGDYFEALESQDYREALLELCINNKSFNTLSVKTNVYKIFQKYIRNKKKYEDSFSDLMVLGNTEEVNSEKINLIEKNEKLELLVFDFSIKKINSLNLSKEYDSNNIPEYLSTIVSQIKVNFLEELGLINITCKKSSEQKIYPNDGKDADNIRIELYGSNLKQDFLKIYFNKLLLSIYSENNFNAYEGKSLLLKEVYSIAQKEMLEKTLTPEKSPKKVNKI